MKTLAVFDPAIAYFDPVLTRFAADLKWIEKYGVKVSRYNLAKEPYAFTANPAVAREMEAGMGRLPVIMVDGHIISTGMYPSREQMAQKLGITAAADELSPVRAVVCPCTPWL